MGYILALSEFAKKRTGTIHFGLRLKRFTGAMSDDKAPIGHAQFHPCSPLP